MARARNIKPGFFRNADLVELPMTARLLFIGLWTMADREGRLEDRPKQIKMELFPADDVDCNACLNDLQSIGVIDRYEHGGLRVIQVVNFSKHQNPHKDEKASTLPNRDGHIADSVHKPKKHRASTVQAPCKDDGNPADSLLLNPDSLIPDPKTKEPSGSLLSASRKTKLPSGFFPNESGIQKAEDSSVNVAIELVKFTDYHRAKGTTMADWQAAWRTWVGNAATFSRAGPANRQASIEARNKAAGEEWLRQEGVV